MADDLHGVALGGAFPLRQAARVAPGRLGRADGRFCLDSGLGITIETPFSFWPIVPVRQPRMNKSDSWKPSASVLRYRAFRDEIRMRKVTACRCGQGVVFLMPIAPSKSKKEREQLHGREHLQTPDVDNLEKALMDALWPKDKGGDHEVWDWRCTKIWSKTPGIVLYDLPRLPFNLPLNLIIEAPA